MLEHTGNGRIIDCTNQKIPTCSTGCVKCTLACPNRLRRLAAHYEQRDDIRHAFLIMGCALICLPLDKHERLSCRS
jgi:hypothetical protein